jgi:hypothetical protein
VFLRPENVCVLPLLVWGYVLFGGPFHSHHGIRGQVDLDIRGRFCQPEGIENTQGQSGRTYKRVRTIDHQQVDPAECEMGLEDTLMRLLRG